jgi:carboxymethylenebutenolidase
MSRRFIAVASLIASACTMQRTQPSQSIAIDDHMAHMSAADMGMPMPARSHGAAEQQGDLKLPPSNNTALARLNASPRHGEWVKIAWEEGSKDSLMAWIVYPMTRAKAPVVVVVHEIFGLSTWVRGVADQVAAEGFIAIAPDFLSRVRGGPTTVELAGDSARRIISGVDVAERNRAISAAASYAMMQPSAQQKYAVIGYCWGGGTTFSHAINGGVRGFVGGVAYYGLPPMAGGQRATATTPAVPATFVVDSVAKIKVPVLLLNGDTRIGAAMPALDTLMKKLGKDYVGIDYPDAAHGFLRLQGDTMAVRNLKQEAANLAASQDAWPRTVAFLKKQLGTK